jgi:hypothetical protein
LNSGINNQRQADGAAILRNCHGISTPRHSQFERCRSNQPSELKKLALHFSEMNQISSPARIDSDAWKSIGSD